MIYYIFTAWLVAWGFVLFEPQLWPVALFGFVQNIAFTFVSRGRNSGSLRYHIVAAIFSNGMYAALLMYSISIIALSETNTGFFLGCYTCATLSGSVFAHWLAVRLEKGKARNVQEDRFNLLQTRVTELEGDLSAPAIQVRLHGEIVHLPISTTWRRYVFARLEKHAT